MRIAVHGASGRLGRLIVQQAAAEGLFPLSLGRTDAIPGDCAAVIDVSSPQGLEGLLARLSGHSLPLVVGTTGALPQQALQDYAQRAPVAVVPNFSAGIPLLLQVLEQVVKALPPGWDIEIVEAHHNQKVDAPSGTALRLGAAVQAAGRPAPPTHSLRVGDTFGEHTVWLCGPGERLQLTHVATRREVFAIGALRWARALQGRAPGLIQP